MNSEHVDELRELRRLVPSVNQKAAIDAAIAALQPGEAVKYQRRMAAPPALPDRAVSEVAWHIGKAVEYIEKNYPDAKMLDRGPIMRNLRRWHALLATHTQEGK